MEASSSNEGIKQYYFTKIEEIQVSTQPSYLRLFLSNEHHNCALAVDLQWRYLFQLVVSEKTQNLRRLEAQRNELNAKG